MVVGVGPSDSSYMYMSCSATFLVCVESMHAQHALHNQKEHKNKLVHRMLICMQKCSAKVHYNVFTYFLQ